jgi:type 1 glutamine amidotransferase
MNPRPDDCRSVLRAALPVLFLLVVAGAPADAQPCGGFRVLVFSRTAGFRHDAQITAGLSLIRSLGAANHFAVDATEDAGRFTPSNLSGYAAVIFLNTTGDVLNAAQEAAFQGYMAAGGGFVGIHSATDTEYGWPFYGAVVGAYFQSHPAVQSARVRVTDPTHVSTAHLPATFSHTDEWYDFGVNPAGNPNIKVLLTVDETTYQGGTMGPVHPIAWYQDLPGIGRSWYTAMGHTLNTYSAPFFRDHLLGGILFVSSKIRTTTITSAQTYGAGSGTPVLGLAARSVSPSTVGLVLSGAAPGGAGILALSTCSASSPLPPYTVLVDLGPMHLVGILPVTFGPSGRFELPVPVQPALPVFLGTSLVAQGAQLFPTVGLSNGLRLDLTP